MVLLNRTIPMQRTVPNLRSYCNSRVGFSLLTFCMTLQLRETPSIFKGCSQSYYMLSLLKFKYILLCFWSFATRTCHEILESESSRQARLLERYLAWSFMTFFQIVDLFFRFARRWLWKAGSTKNGNPQLEISVTKRLPEAGTCSSLSVPPVYRT